MFVVCYFHEYPNWDKLLAVGYTILIIQQTQLLYSMEILIEPNDDSVGCVKLWEYKDQ